MIAPKIVWFVEAFPLILRFAIILIIISGMFATFNPHLNWILCWFWLKQIDGDIEDREQYDDNPNHD